MNALVRWLIFTGRAPQSPWFRRLAMRRLSIYTIHGDHLFNLGSAATPEQVRRFREWWRNDGR